MSKSSYSSKMKDRSVEGNESQSTPEPSSSEMEKTLCLSDHDKSYLNHDK